MYGAKGKFVILLLFAAGGAALGLVFLKVAMPGLEEKKRLLEATTAPVSQSTATQPQPPSKDGNGKDGNGGNLVIPKAKDDNTSVVPPIAPGLTPFQRVLMHPVKGPDGKEIPIAALKFKVKDDDGKPLDGGMVRAFFDKDAEFKKMSPAEQQKAMPERHGEREALLAWSILPDAERKKAFDADSFSLPPELAKKPITSDYAAGGKVKIKRLIEDRCISCHAGEDDEVMFVDYASLKRFLDRK
jgi:hypothetical protein